eukprot:scaffold244_cov416-Prasinococcus_capsulatus_cf.AAC.7
MGTLHFDLGVGQAGAAAGTLTANAEHCCPLEPASQGQCAADLAAGGAALPHVERWNSGLLLDLRRQFDSLNYVPEFAAESARPLRQCEEGLHAEKAPAEAVRGAATREPGHALRSLIFVTGQLVWPPRDDLQPEIHVWANSMLPSFVVEHIPGVRHCHRGRSRSAATTALGLDESARQ